MTARAETPTHEELYAIARAHVEVMANAREALAGLLEGVETARQSFPRGSREERIITGALAGWDEAARRVLGE